MTVKSMAVLEGVNVWIALQLFFTFYISGIQAAVTLDADALTQIDQFIQSAMACQHLPGLSVAVVTKDQVLLQKGYGYADTATKVPVTKDTLFPIASTTKAFTTAALAMLLEKSDFTWDTPIKEIDPELKLHSDLLTSHVTLRDILTHRTGIPGYFIAIMAGYPDDLSVADIIKDFHYHPPTEPLRTEFIYNNYMYGLAGYLAELLADSSWEDLISEKIFKPLNMTDSTFVKDLQLKDNNLNMAKPYVHKDNETVEIDLTTIRQVNIASPAGGIVSNAKDMSSWLQFHLRQGELPSGQSLMSTASLQSLYKTPIGGTSVMPDMTKPTFPVSDIGQTYALGWINNIYRGYRRVWHSGGILTYKSQVWLLPGLDAGIFLVTNGPNTSTSWGMIHMAQFITDLLAGETPWLNTTTVCTFPSPWKNNTNSHSIQEELISHPLPKASSCYTGTYTHPAFGEITISEHSSANKLKMKMGLYIDADLLYNKQKDTFFTRLTNKYWYLDDQIPIQFRNLHKLEIANTFSTILMPLCQPYQSANKIAFQKNLDEYVFIQTSEGPRNNAFGIHTSNMNIYTVFFLFFIISFAASR